MSKSRGSSCRFFRGSIELRCCGISVGRQQKNGWFEAVNVAQSESEAVVTTMFGRYDPGYSGTAREYMAC